MSCNSKTKNQICEKFRPKLELLRLLVSQTGTDGDSKGILCYDKLSSAGR